MVTQENYIHDKDFDLEKMNLTKEDRRWIHNKLVHLFDLKLDELNESFNRNLIDYFNGMYKYIDSINININKYETESSEIPEIPNISKKTRKKKKTKKKSSPINADLSKLGF